MSERVNREREACEEVGVEFFFFSFREGGLVVVIVASPFAIPNHQSSYLERPLRCLRRGPVRPQGFVDHHRLLGSVGPAAGGRRGVERVVGRCHVFFPNDCSSLFPQKAAVSRALKGLSLAREEDERRAGGVRWYAAGTEKGRESERKGSRFGVAKRRGARVLVLRRKKKRKNCASLSLGRCAPSPSPPPPRERKKKNGDPLSRPPPPLSFS